MQGIYQIRNIKNNKLYIGSSKDIEKRWKQHLAQLKKGNHHSSKLQNSYNHAKDKNIFEFSVIEEIIDNNKLKEREQYYIDLFNSYHVGYNCCEKTDEFSIKHTLKYQKKKNDKILLEDYYNEFIKIYKQDNIIIGYGKTFIDRLLDKYYKKDVYKNIIEMIMWFNKHYDKKYIGQITCNGKYYLTISDSNNNKFVDYWYTKKKMLVSKDDTNTYVEILHSKNLWDDNIHKMIS